MFAPPPAPGGFSGHLGNVANAAACGGDLETRPLETGGGAPGGGAPTAGFNPHGMAQSILNHAATQAA